MTITSTAFESNTLMSSKYTCDGANINPPLSFHDIPKTAKSLLLLVDDPDAPHGTWRHWSVYNMPPTTNGIPEGSKPESGAEGITDFGTVGYGGPCPPSGSHRYFFKLYALDIMLDLPEKPTFNEIENAIQNHVVVKAELVGIYSRSQ
ncbi:MAG: YbhB/YbcL family Raf kinase inhibitor-like protein [Candidatus Levybacteria bacterium]|nr:YbhB/YbcL family Raf kinase inhibitor-like protein [Candidatus Levybacteria bacterium]